jgi:hypothetical protein
MEQSEERGRNPVWREDRHKSHASDHTRRPSRAHARRVHQPRLGLISRFNHCRAANLQDGVSHGDDAAYHAATITDAR